MWFWGATSRCQGANRPTSGPAAQPKMTHSDRFRFVLRTVEPRGIRVPMSWLLSDGSPEVGMKLRLLVLRQCSQRNHAPQLAGVMLRLARSDRFLRFTPDSVTRL